jgi:hypothetical protein
MDWARAVEINRVALSRIVAELLAMVGLMSTVKMERLLRPAESALRRLIVIAARGLVVQPSPKRPMPKGLTNARVLTSSNLKTRSWFTSKPMNAIPSIRSVRIINRGQLTRIAV